MDCETKQRKLFFRGSTVLRLAAWKSDLIAKRALHWQLTTFKIKKSFKNIKIKKDVNVLSSLVTLYQIARDSS